MDIRRLISSYASGIRISCESVALLVNSTTKSYLGNSVYTPLVRSRSNIELEIQTLINTLGNDAPKLAANVLKIADMGISIQLLITAFGTNARGYIEQNINKTAFVDINTYEMEDGSLCYCFPAMQCSSPAAIYFTPISSTSEILSVRMNKTIIRGMKTDCYPTVGLQASSFECYYNYSCIQALVADDSVFEPLNASLPSKFSVTSTLKDILESSLIEEFSFDYSIEQYYEGCSPPFCVYSYVHLNTRLTIISTIISVLSVLHITLSTIVPILVTALLKFIQHFLHLKNRPVDMPTPIPETRRIVFF